jgi:hypothetical protein
MKLETAFLAQSAEVLRDGRLFVFGGGVQGFAARGFPIIVPSIYIVAHIFYAPRDLDEVHELKVTMSGPPEDSPGFISTQSVTPKRDEFTTDSGISLPAVFGIANLKLDGAWLHVARFYGDEAPIGEFRFWVRQLPTEIESA